MTHVALPRGWPPLHRGHLHKLSDHQGAPISALQSTRCQVPQPSGRGAQGKGLPWLTLPVGWTFQGARHRPVASSQRVSVWASNWLRDHCELLAWLSFPALATLKVSTVGHPRWVGLVMAHSHSPTYLPIGSQPPATHPGSLLPLGQGPAGLCRLWCAHRAGVLQAPPPAGVWTWSSLWVCSGSPCSPGASAACPQVLERIPLPAIAISLSLSHQVHLMAICPVAEYPDPAQRGPGGPGPLCRAGALDHSCAVHPQRVP